MEAEILQTLEFKIPHLTIFEEASIKLRVTLSKTREEKGVALYKQNEDELFNLLTYLSYISTT